MKRMYRLLSLVLTVVLLTSCGGNSVQADPADGTGSFLSVTQDVFPDAPPTMTIVCGEESVTAWRGSYSWHILLDNGMGRGKHADSMHPLSALDGVPVIAADDGTEVTLVFEVPEAELPVTSLEVRRYRTDAEDYEDYETVTVDGTTLTLTGDDALYEVIASWDVSDGAYRGTARYAFRAAEE